MDTEAVKYYLDMYFGVTIHEVTTEELTTILSSLEFQSFHQGWLSERRFMQEIGIEELKELNNSKPGKISIDVGKYRAKKNRERLRTIFRAQ